MNGDTCGLPPARRRRTLVAALAALLAAGCTSAPRSQPSAAPALSQADDAFLEDLSRRSFRYFVEQADAGTGLVRDRAPADGSAPSGRDRDVASIAATGFGLTALCIGAERGWIGATEARDQARRTLRFFVERAPHEHGWLYHWMDAPSGERRWQSEVSSIDTALLLAGALTARQCFRDDTAIVTLATTLFERVDFGWMRAGAPALLSMGWKPESGFLAARWDRHFEQPLLVLLGLASPTHPLGPESWSAWKRDWVSYGGYHFVSGAGPLFIHQFSAAWIDFRGWRDAAPPQLDYFENAATATRAQRLFCLDLAERFPGYAEHVWGITSSDSAKGYVAWGGPPAEGPIDGTVAPCAAAGSLMLAPDVALPAVRHMHARFGERIYGHYGFVDAFNPSTGWVGRDVIGIDLGITLLSAENLRSERVWRWFMANVEMPQAMRRAGLERARPAGQR